MTQGRYMLDTFSKVDFNEILVLMLMCRFWNLVVKFIHTLLVLERLAIHSLNLLGNCFKHSSSYLAACFFGCLNYKQVWCMWLSFFKRVFPLFFSYEMLCTWLRKTPRHKDKGNWCHCCTLEITFPVWITTRSLFYLPHRDFPVYVNLHKSAVKNETFSKFSLQRPGWK